MIDGLLGRGCYTVHELFKQYGPVVRIEPNLVVFADPKYVRQVYGHGTPFHKTEVGPHPPQFTYKRSDSLSMQFYKAFSFDPHDASAMSTMDNKVRAKRRAFYARPMARANIVSQQHLVQVCAWENIHLCTDIISMTIFFQERCEMLVQALTKQSKLGDVDMAKYWGFYTHDVVVRVIT